MQQECANFAKDLLAQAEIAAKYSAQNLLPGGGKSTSWEYNAGRDCTFAWSILRNLYCDVFSGEPGSIETLPLPTPSPLSSLRPSAAWSLRDYDVLQLCVPCIRDEAENVGGTRRIGLERGMDWLEEG